MPIVIMPKMGDGMEEGTLLRWLKNAGDDIEAGEPLAEIETDKVSLEIEATDSGKLTQILVGEGDTVAIGTPIATIGDVDASELGAASPPPTVAATPALPTAAAPPAAVVAPPVIASTPLPPPAPAEAGASGDRLRASPIVKQLAAEHGIDLAAIAGTGPGGRIVKDDLKPYLTGARPIPAAKPALQPTVAATPALPPVGGPRPAAVPREMSRIRKTTGKRMTEAKDIIPHFYVTSAVDMGPALAFREQFNAQVTDDVSKISVNDMIVKASALALRQFMNLNTSLEGDTWYDHPNIDVNVAVAIENGLIAPFVTDADQRSLASIARSTKDLISRARTGGLTMDEYQGGTFTISNLGMLDVEEFIAVINPPQAAILAVASSMETPVVKDGQVTIGHRMNLTLSADHRVTDGAEVARFLQEVKANLENPFRLVAQ